MKLFVVVLSLFCTAAFVQAEENNEQKYLEKFVPDEATEVDEPKEKITKSKQKFYAGPLKSTEEDEVIVVSRDNIQQLIKTLMIAYTHSKDPTMMQLFKSGGLGAMKTSFKYLDQEELGNTILSAAEAYLSELDLEMSQEEFLGELAEAFLEKHKFKIVVPESFLLHEKDMIEFIGKKMKSQKKGRSLPGFDDEEEKELELLSVLPYSGRQFSTSVIPGLDLTWLALLGGMIAIPYYFLADGSSSAAAPVARKDTITAPLPNLTPPAFNSIDPQQPKKMRRVQRPNGAKRPLRRRIRPNNQNQRTHPYHNQQQRRRQNNQLIKQIQQNTKVPIPQGGGDPKLTILPPIHAVPNQAGPHVGQEPSPFHHQGPLSSPSIADGLLPSQLTGTNNHPKVTFNINENLSAPPPSSNSQDGQQSPEERKITIQNQHPKIVLNAPPINIDRSQFVNHGPAQHNTIAHLNEEQLKRQNSFSVGPGHLNRIPHPPPPPANIGLFNGLQQQPPRAPAPFVPTHFENGTAINPQQAHNVQPPRPNFFAPPPNGRPQVPVPGLRQPLIPRNQIPPMHGHGFRHPIVNHHHRVPPFGLRHQQINHQQQHPSIPPQIPIPGIRGVPQGVDESRLRPLLSGQGQQEFRGDNREESISGTETKPDNTHFKVQHGEATSTVGFQGPVNVQKFRNPVVDEPLDKEVVGDSLLEESISSPTIVYATPHLNLPSNNVQKLSEEKKDLVPTLVIFHSKDKNEKRPIFDMRKPSTPSPHDGGFVPILGPPQSAELPESKMPIVTKPVDFLDKLISENQQQRMSSRLDIKYGEPFSVTDGNGIYPPRQPGVFEPRTIPTTTQQPITTTTSTSTTTPKPTTALPQNHGASLFIQMQTEQPEKRETAVEDKSNVEPFQQNFRVVTSKSVVTSRPLPLDQTFNFNFGESLNDGVLAVKSNEQEEYVLNPAPVINEVYESEATVEEVRPNNDQFRDYENSYGTLIQKSEPIFSYSLDGDIANQQTGEYVEVTEEEEEPQLERQDNFENEYSNDVERILKTVSLESVLNAEPKDSVMDKDSRSLDNIPIYSLDPFYGPRLSRIDAIFHQMKLETEGCRQQVVCNMYKNPDGYAPLSDFLSRQLTVTLEELKKPQVKDERILRFFRYLHSATIGQDGGDCQYEYPECSHDTTKLYNKPTMDYYHKVTDLIDRSSFQS